jgi:hypothetical protein
LFFVSPADAQSSAEIRDQIAKTIPDAKKELIKLTPSGPVPARIEIAQLDASVFFLNVTDDSLVSLEIQFGPNRVHCWSPNLQIDEKGVMSSINPIGPKDFAITCFPEAGTYRYTVKGLEKNPSGSTGEIVIR